MKWLLLLTLVLSCTTQEKAKKAPTPAPAPTATESDAQPVNPSTVNPCVCMKIFKPVCADGVSYGNSCEAECHGHKTWAEGNCKPKK